MTVDDKEFDAVFEPIFREEFSHAFKEIRDGMKMARDRVKNGEQVVQSTQGQHDAIHLTIAGLQARFLSLLRLHKQAREKLEARLAAIEEKGVQYRGVWQAPEDYTRGDLVTLDGSMWYCNANTRAKPGKGSRAWTLAVRRGADGKDAR